MITVEGFHRRTAAAKSKPIFLCGPFHEAIILCANILPSLRLRENYLHPSDSRRKVPLTVQAEGFTLFR